MIARIVCCAAVVFWLGCDEKDPEVTDIPTDNDSDGDGETDQCVDTEFAEDVEACQPFADDYRPRDNASADDSWASCISDDNLYHQFEATVSSIARVATYETIGDLLWNRSTLPTSQDFIDARVLFEEEQGLGSRIARRYDVHYTPPSQGTCDETGIAEANPEYCVGPATLQPIIVNAFAEGSLGKEPAWNAARIRAALQWFFYVSAIKEATTCFDALKDCDSSWAYYSGGTLRGEPVGLAAEIMALGQETHNRAYDGLLAVRCWRDLDDAVPALNKEMHQRAIAQLDRALLRGLALILRERFVALNCPNETDRQSAHEALKILVPLLDRETRVRDASAADLIKNEVAKESNSIDVEAVVTALDATYPCP